MALPFSSRASFSSSDAAAAATITTPSGMSFDVNPPIPSSIYRPLQEVLQAGASYTTTERYLIDTRHADYVNSLFDRRQGAVKYTIKAKPSRDNIDFITPPVTPHVYPMSNRTRAHVNFAFKEFSKRFCSKYYIPDDVSMCISLLFNGMDGHGETDTCTRTLVDKIIKHHSLYVSKDNDSHYTIPPSFYFLHALNAINSGCANVNVHPETFKQVGMRVSASVLRYSLFELGDVYLRILIKSLNEERAPPSLLLDAPPDLVPLTECHARVLAARIKRMGILPRDGIMSTAIYRLYFDTIEGCNVGLRPIPFDPDMVYSDCVFELKQLVRQGKIIMKTEKRKLLVVEKEDDAPSTKRRCVVGSEGGRVAIVKTDSSSLVPLELEECESDGEELAFLNKNETALARLLKRLETSGYCSFIDVEDAPGAGGDGAEEALVRFLEPVLADLSFLHVFSENMSISGFDTAVRRLEKNRGGVVKEKLLSSIRKHRGVIEPVHRCREIHPKSTLRPAIELSLGKDFPFEATVLAIFNRLSVLAKAGRIGRPAHCDVIDEFSPVGYTALAKTFIALSIREKTASIPDGEERELKVLKDFVDVVEVSSRNNNKFHPYGIVSWLLDPNEGYEYEYPEVNIDALFSYVLDMLCNYFTEKGPMRSFYENNLFDKVRPDVYSSCVEQYLKKRAFAADNINTAIDAMCYVESGYYALVWIVRNAFPNNEDGKKTAFMRMIRNTVTQPASSSPIHTSDTREEGPPSPSTSLEVLVEAFPGMCYMADKDFGVLRECIERESLAIFKIMALPNVRATINCRYRYYGNAPAICLGHLMADTVRHDTFVCAFLKNGADPSVTTDEGENIMHFMARGPPLTNEGRPLDSFVTTVKPYQEWRKLRTDSEKTKHLFAARRHYDGATPIMVAVAHKNFCALKIFRKHFPVDDVFLAFNTAFGRSDCLRTIDVMVLSGMLFPNLFNQGNVMTAEPSVRLLSKAALEGKLYCNGDSPAPLNRVGLTFDEYAYRGVRNIKQAICHNICACKFASGSRVQKGNRRNEIVASFEHKDGIWCALNYANNATVDQIYSEDCITYWMSFKKEYVELCAAIANNDRETLEKMGRIGERKRGNLTYNDGKCAICLEVLNETVKELTYIEECDHVYHKLCIRDWENVKRVCPICNTEYVNSVSRGDEDVITQG
uniref:E3 ligase n=1 Tax=Hemigrapsus takanoi nimavirus TaxID=2133792 RepID=A0A401IP44_9VIRU|nr:MAG: E3 ligase [Hemigrapsus takanoi nimavirus]GBG35388.1 E3 ligase [Hemigrapsus takanoi nimavirus]